MKISIRIPKTLNEPVELEVDGAKGTQCLEATRKLRSQMLAQSPLKRKDEFHQTVGTGVCAQVG